MTNTNTVFYDNELWDGDKVATACGNLYGLCLTADMNTLVAGVKGVNKQVTMVLEELLSYKKELEQGLIVRVHIDTDKEVVSKVELFTSEEYEEEV